jgi:sulfhydrogenase subunit beta (sulfur reductase)
MGKQKQQAMVLDKAKLPDLIEALSAKAVCLGPVRSADGPRWERLSASSVLDLKSVNTRLSPKEFFLPRREVLCTFRGDKLEELPPESKAERTVLFGVRPCDARALQCLDLVFGAGQSRFSDPYYLERRERTLIITLACREPGRTCFCTSLGGSPADTEGADVAAVDLGAEFLLTAVTDIGRALLEEHEALLTAPDQSRLESARKQAERARSQVQAVDLEKLTETLKQDFEDPVWEELARPCLGCGICAYVCPTCHCFDISDEVDSRGAGVRIRSWDCCQYPLFTRHASGHNPRVSRKQRLRQRIMHKYAYTLETSGVVFCVGCGRCILNCPAHLDIRMTLRTLQTRSGRS